MPRAEISTRMIGPTAINPKGRLAGGCPEEEDEYAEGNCDSRDDCLSLALCNRIRDLNVYDGLRGQCDLAVVTQPQFLDFLGHVHRATRVAGKCLELKQHRVNAFRIVDQDLRNNFGLLGFQFVNEFLREYCVKVQACGRLLKKHRQLGVVLVVRPAVICDPVKRDLGERETDVALHACRSLSFILKRCHEIPQVQDCPSLRQFRIYEYIHHLCRTAQGSFECLEVLDHFTIPR